MKIELSSQRSEVFLFLTTNIAAVTYVTYKPGKAPLKIQLTFLSAKHLPLLLFASEVENYAATDSIVNAFFFSSSRARAVKTSANLCGLHSNGILTFFHD